MLVAIYAFLEIPHDELVGDAVDWISLVVWCAFASRRLRDAGLPFWAAPFPLPVILIGAGLNRLFPTPPEELTRTVTQVSTISLVSTLFLLALVVVLGCLPSLAPKATADQTAEVFG